jgi:hypothetical protein
VSLSFEADVISHESAKARNPSDLFRVFVFSWLLALVASVTPVAAQQTFTGRLSDSACAASHQPKAAADSLTDRECLLACIKTLAKYVLVDQDHNVLQIENQDAMGLPLYAGRPVRITGERKGDAILVTKVEAIPAHLHIGHVMTNWRDTPGTRGFLPVAIDEARVAVLHAELAAKATSLDDIKTHAGHVMHALDPAVEPKGPGAGYGVRNAVTGALQHLEFAAKADGATIVVTTNAIRSRAPLMNVLNYVDQAGLVAQRIRAATDTAEALRLAAELAAWTRRISDDGLQPVQTSMDLILKAEGLLGAPR